MYLELEIHKVKTCIKNLTLILYGSAALSRNRYVKKLDADSLVFKRRVPRPLHILRNGASKTFQSQNIPLKI